MDELSLEKQLIEQSLHLQRVYENLDIAQSNNIYFKKVITKLTNCIHISVMFNVFIFLFK